MKKIFLVFILVTFTIADINDQNNDTNDKNIDLEDNMNQDYMPDMKDMKEMMEKMGMKSSDIDPDFLNSLEMNLKEQENSNLNLDNTKSQNINNIEMKDISEVKNNVEVNTTDLNNKKDDNKAILNSPDNEMNRSLSIPKVNDVDEKQKNADSLKLAQPSIPSPNRKLSEEEKIEDIEKRLFSIEDKVDHLLLHAGHDLTPHKTVWTPWGPHLMPNYNNKESLHHKLSMVDHLMHPYGMGMGMGMMHHPMGMMGMPLMDHHLMGIGHANPWGYGLDHVGGFGFGNPMSMGLGRRSSYQGSSNPFYTGDGSII